MLAMFNEVLDHGKTKKAIFNVRYPIGTDFVRSVACGTACGAGAAAQSMFELCGGLQECGERLSPRSGMPGQSTCSSSAVPPGLRLAPVLEAAGRLSPGYVP